MYSFFTHIATSTESTFEMRFPLQNLKAGSPQSTLLFPLHDAAVRVNENLERVARENGHPLSPPRAHTLPGGVHAGARGLWRSAPAPRTLPGVRGLGRGLVERREGDLRYRVVCKRAVRREDGR